MISNQTGRLEFVLMNTQKSAHLAISSSIFFLNIQLPHNTGCLVICLELTAPETSWTKLSEDHSRKRKIHKQSWFLEKNYFMPRLKTKLCLKHNYYNSSMNQLIRLKEWHSNKTIYAVFLVWASPPKVPTYPKAIHFNERQQGSKMKNGVIGQVWSSRYFI